MDKTKTIIILGVIIAFLILVIVCFLLQIKYNQIVEKEFLKGYNGGKLEVINRINTEGTLPVVSRQENKTSINWFTIKQVCERIK